MKPMWIDFFQKALTYDAFKIPESCNITNDENRQKDKRLKINADD